MMELLAQALINQPEIAIFLALGLGFWIGKFQYKGIGLGAVTGTLLVGVVIGAVVSVPGPDGTPQTIEISNVVKQVFFLLFLFSLGVRVGPQFFAGLRGNGRNQAIFTVLMLAVGVATVIILSKILGYDPGLAAGLAAGALTQSSIIGVAQSAIAGLPEDAATLAEWEDLVSVGYAVTYIFGTVGAAVYAANIAPRLLGIKDLPAAAKEDEKKLGFKEELADTMSAYSRIQRRTFTVPTAMAGLTMLQLEKRLASTISARLYIDRARSNGKILEIGTDARLNAGDVVTLTVIDSNVFHQLEEAGFAEVQDAALLDFPIEELEIIVTNDEVADKTLRELGLRTQARGIFVKSLKRADQEMPLLPDTQVAHGDLVRIQGPRSLVEAVIPHIGYPERSTPQTDMVTVGLGIAVGALIGLPAITVDNIPLSLTSSVGAMLIGLIIGWRRAKSPTFGRIPAGAQWFFESVGLAAFIAVVGINAGPGFVDGLAEYGLGLFFAGVVVTLVPLIAGTLMARYLFHFDPVQALGMITGAQTTTAAVGALQEAAQSSVPLLGFTTPYAIGNIFLSIAGALVVALMY
jgi:putative transport protein